jgi:DNA-binding response OmpR family regulator
MLFLGKSFATGMFMEKKPLCLVIEDDEDLSIIFGDALKAAGFETEIIYDGQDALDRLEQVIPTIVILDLHLPRVDGTQILGFIRKQSGMEDTNVVVVTADAVMADKVRAEADFVLIKPITFGQLRDLTARLNPTSAEA